MPISRRKMRSILKKFYHVELVVLAEWLSNGREKWAYSKRSKAKIADAIAANAQPTELVKELKNLCGKRLPPEFGQDLEEFPPAIQIGNYVVGPLGFLETSVRRSHWESNEAIGLIERCLGKSKYLRLFVEGLQEKIPENVFSKIRRSDYAKPELVQCILAYATDEIFSDIVNKRIDEDLIEIDLSSLYGARAHEFSPWIVTRYGIFTEPDEEGVENLSNLLKRKFKEEDLSAELKPYSGDYKTRLLEYCIKENPRKILLHLFGTPSLRRIAKRQGFAKIDTIEDEDELVTLILLKLGFNVPPSLIGISSYIVQLQRHKSDLLESKDTRRKSGVMAQVYVETEKILKDLSFFYVHSIWPKTIANIESELEEREELTNLQRKVKAVDRILKNKLRIEKPFDRLGFGDFLDILSRLSGLIHRSIRVRRRMERTFDRSKVLPMDMVKSLRKVSPYRASFVHIKDFPGDEVCESIVKNLLDFAYELQSGRIYPIILRMSREIEDEFGKTFAEAVDDHGNKWIVYTRKRLEPTIPYFMYSRTTSIAINPILVEKIC